MSIVLNVSPSAEEFHKTGVTIGFVILFFKCPFVKLFQAEGTQEMFGVELLSHGCDASPGDWLLAASTEGAAFGMVVGLAVWQSLVVKETAASKWLVAVLNCTNMSVKIL